MFVLHADGAAPATKIRAWCLTCELEIPDGGASGPIAVVGGETGGWSLYMNGGVATFCYNFDGVERTYIRANQPLGTQRHSLRLEFEVADSAGTARLFVDHDMVAEGAIPRTMAFAYSLDETFNIGSDKGAPVTHEYAPLAAFSGTIVGVTVDLGGY
jgi:arylsulfatase